MNQDEFVEVVIAEARQRRYPVENSRNGRQIDFGHKKLHEGHLQALYPDILADGANVSDLIEKVAPGRPCSHRPIKEILASIKRKQIAQPTNPGDSQPAGTRAKNA